MSRLWFVLLIIMNPRLAVGQESPVVAALMAQVEGLGGCSDLEHIDTLSFPYWPELSFYKGRCTREHDHIAFPWAVRLQDGSVLPLGSRTAFRYLLRRAPPIGITDETRLDYVHRALIWMDQVPEMAELPRYPKTSTSPALCTQVGLKCSGLFTPEFEPSPSRSDHYKFYLTFTTPDAIYSTGPGLLNTTTGIIDAVVHEHYAGGDTLR
jgi:hypothetical protein